MTRFTASSEYIDCSHPAVAAKAAELAAGSSDKIEIARRCFEFVRDQIRHSSDYRFNPVTCKASDVLLHATGYCYAKSHLLAALLRANGIPAGLCYQRLLIEPGGRDCPDFRGHHRKAMVAENGTVPFTDSLFSLHGLNAVYLPDYGWYRIDARGNKPGVCAEFCPPVEKLAFPIVNPGELDLPEIWPEPLPVVVHTLTKYSTYDQVYRNLPDLT
jgi:transglutaminase-like putative cysteine protease